MPRSLAFGNIKRVGTYILAKKSSSLSLARNHGPLSSVGMPSSQYRFYLQFKLPSRGCLPFTAYKTKENICRISSIKNFSTLSARNFVTHHVHVAWKRLYHTYSHCSRSFPPTSNIACMLSLAFTRSHMAPSIFAFFFYWRGGMDSKDMGRYNVLPNKRFSVYDSTRWASSFHLVHFYSFRRSYFAVKISLFSNFVLAGHSNGPICRFFW